MGDGVLHEGPAALGEGAGHDVRLRHGLRGAGELAVVIDRGIVLAGLGQHEGVDALGAGELLQIGARAFDGLAVVVLGEGILFLEFGGVEIELLLRQRHAVGVGAAIARPPARQHRREEKLVLLSWCDVVIRYAFRAS